MWQPKCSVSVCIWFRDWAHLNPESIVRVLQHPHRTFDNYFSIFVQNIHIHPKTLIEMWITCLDRVSANAEKGRGSEWAVRVGQRLQSRFGKNGAARKSGLVQIVVEVSAIRGGLPSTWPFEPVFGWRGRSVLRDYRHGLLFGTACYKLYIVEVMVCSWHSWIYSTPFRRASTFSWPVVSLRPARNMSLGRWLLVACFSSVKNHNVSGPLLFPSFTTWRDMPKKSLCHP